jgi:hypothetical protein
MFLIGRQPLQAMSAQNAVHGGGRHRHAMKALQIVANPTRTEVIRFAQVQHLADDVVRRGVREVTRNAGPIAQAGLAMIVEAPFPLVVGLPRDPEMSARPRHIAGHPRRLLQDLEPPGHEPSALSVCHKALHSSCTASEESRELLP